MGLELKLTFDKDGAFLEEREVRDPSGNAHLRRSRAERDDGTEPFEFTDRFRKLCCLLLTYKLWGMHDTNSPVCTVTTSETANEGSILKSIHGMLTDHKHVKWLESAFGFGGTTAEDRLEQVMKAHSRKSASDSKIYEITIYRAELSPDDITVKRGQDEISRSGDIDDLLGILCRDDEKPTCNGKVPVEQPKLFERHDWMNMRDALQIVISEIPAAEEVMFLGYNSKMLCQDLHTFAGRWRAKRLRVLVNDIYSIDQSRPNMIPRSDDEEWWKRRVRLTDDNDYTLREQTKAVLHIDALKIRYFPSYPQLRVFLVDERLGVLNWYRQYYKPKTEFTGRGALATIVRRPAWGEFIDQLLGWYNFVWDYRSYSLEEAKRLARVPLPPPE